MTRAGSPSLGIAPLVTTLVLLTGCSSQAPSPVDLVQGVPAREPIIGASRAPSASGGDVGSTQRSQRGLPPVQLSLPSIGVVSDVVPVVDVDRVLQPPARPWQVGWWSRGVGVDAAVGTTVLAVHLDSRRYGSGPYARLGGIHRGDPVTIVDSAGAEHLFEVFSVRTYPKSSAPWSEIFDQRSARRVVLVTCGGTYRRDAGGWDSNVVAVFTPA